MTRSRDNATNVAGDISGVTAGTGLSGGGTDGAVTLNLSTPVAATNGGTGLSTFTTGDIPYASASNTLAKLAIGSTNQVLTVASGIPSWATASSGAYTTLASGSLSGAALAVTSLSTDYRDLVFIMRDFYFNVDTSLYFRVNNTSSIYYSARGSYEDIGVTVGQSAFQMAGSEYDSRDANNFSYWRIFDYANTSSMKMGTAYTAFGEAGGSTFNVMLANSVINTTSAITQLNVATNGAGYTFSGGTYTVYGVK